MALSWNAIKDSTKFPETSLLICININTKPLLPTDKKKKRVKK